MKLTTFLTWLAIGAAGLVGYDHFTPGQDAPVEPAAAPVRVVQAQPQPQGEDRSWIKPRDGGNAAPAASGGSFQCDGRTHCSQMRSCAEARHFIQHCPNTKMDGDRDGVPCEEQWC
jgi:hypothetical protein